MKLFVLVWLIPTLLFASSNRVEELFIWKVSEELKLSVKQEADFAKMVRDFSQKRSAVNLQIEEALAKLKAPSADSKEVKKTLATYKKLLSDYHRLSVSEVDRAESILGTEKAARYFVLKADLTNQLKNALSDKKPEPAKAAPATP